MGRFFEALKAGVAGYKDAAGPREYTIAGRPLRCPHCGHTKFMPGRAMLNTAGRTFFKLDWTDPSATILVCSECARIEWFAQEPDSVS
jgi:hypothetical protein